MKTDSQRTIKFRVWDFKNKKWFSQEVLGALPLKVFLASENLQQFTGLKDSNEKEIYEGDIVLLENKKYEVLFCKGCFVGVSSLDKEEIFLFQWNEKLKIIGNIFENPENK